MRRVDLIAALTTNQTVIVDCTNLRAVDIALANPSAGALNFGLNGNYGGVNFQIATNVSVPAFTTALVHLADGPSAAVLVGAAAGAFTTALAVPGLLFITLGGTFSIGVQGVYDD